MLQAAGDHELCVLAAQTGGMSRRLSLSITSMPIQPRCCRLLPAATDCHRLGRPDLVPAQGSRGGCGPAAEGMEGTALHIGSVLARQQD